MITLMTKTKYLLLIATCSTYFLNASVGERINYMLNLTTIDLPIVFGYSKMIESTCPRKEKECEGACTWEDGSRYSGGFNYGTPSGKGTLYWANGDKYVGEFKDGMRHGWGIQTMVDGSVYEGEWRYGRMDGNGKYTYNDGHQYSCLLYTSPSPRD